MERVIVFIDGSNLYKILRKMLKYIKSHEIDECIHIFSIFFENLSPFSGLVNVSNEIEISDFGECIEGFFDKIQE